MKKIGRITLFALLALFVAGAAQAAFAESSQSQIKKAKLKLTA